MNLVRFCLNLSRPRILAYYRGVASQISVCADDGRVVQFPADWLRPHVSVKGVHGRFEMRFSAENKLIELRRIGE